MYLPPPGPSAYPSASGGRAGRPAHGPGYGHRSVWRLRASRRAVRALAQGAAFTLVELLVVMTIIILLLALIVPVFRGNSLNPAVASVAGTLEQARAYAMANNTYVYVGIGEFDAAKDASANPQTVGIGRVVLATVASRDGTRGYDLITPDTDWTANYNNGARLVALSNLQRLDNVHLADTLDSSVQTAAETQPVSQPQPSTVGTGQMARPNLSYYRLGNPNCVSITPFDWPLGKTLGSGQYHFDKVIQFDPQGVARMPRASDPENIVIGVEASLQPARGNVAPPAPTTSNVGNHVAVQLDAMSGAVRIFRP